MSLQIIGSRKSKPWTLEEVTLSPEELAEIEREEANTPKNDVSEVREAEEKEESQTTAIKKQGMIYVPSINLYVSEGRVLQSRNWNQQTEELHSKNKRMPTLPEFVSFVNYLRSDEGRKAVPNHQAILDEIYKVGGDWRSENLDAFFIKKSGELYVAYHKFDKGRIIRTEEKLEDYHSTNETPGIDLDSWLANPNNQGLPRNAISRGRLYYWKPVENSVARFVASSDWAFLNCSWDPAGADGSFGVRFVEPLASGEDRAKNTQGGNK